MSEIAAQAAPPRATPSLDVTSAEAKARIRKRYRAEARFRAYGLMAIGFAGLFLVVLIGSILMRGLPAFWVNTLDLPVTLAADDIDPGKTGNPAEIAKGNFAASIRDALLAKFPEASDRASRRKLSGLVSSGAADELRRRAMADPALVGTTVGAPLLLSDDADLYLRGSVASLDVSSGRGAATPSGTEGAIEIVSTAPDFLAHLEAVKAGLGAQLGKTRREMNALDERLADYDSLIRGLTVQIAQASGDTAILQRDLDKAKADRETLAAQRAQFDAKLVDLKIRVGAPQAAEVIDATAPSLLLRLNGGLLKVTSVSGATVKGDVIVPLANVEPAAPGAWSLLGIDVPEADRRVSDQEILWLEDLKAQGAVSTRFNWAFFTSGDSREPELAGILGGLVGSLLTLFVTLVICLPIGVAAAVYLEEFAPKNRLTSLIEVNINNLAAVPSIVFGLLGLAVFLNFFGMPRSSALVGGLVLALLVLPTIIIASRAALKAVPPSIREGALGVGASQQQAVFHHVLPLAMPGILTGTIIGMAHALGETAPLLMIGMIAFIVDVPSGFTQAATALPVQIFLWSDLPEVAFQAKTSAAIIVLLVFLFVMNGAAILLRRRFERRW